MPRRTNKEQIEQFISKNLEALKIHIKEDDANEVREWVNYKVNDYRENWKELGI